MKDPPGGYRIHDQYRTKPGWLAGQLVSYFAYLLECAYEIVSDEIDAL
jgi:hypothetical protein